MLATVTYRGFTLQGLYNSQNKGVPTAYFDSLFNDPRTRNLQGIDYLDLQLPTRARTTVATGRADFRQQNTLYGPVAYDLHRRRRTPTRTTASGGTLRSN